MKPNPTDPNWWRKISMPNWCEYLILKKISIESKKITPYKISQYAEKLEECGKSYGIYNNMKRLLQQWQKDGLIKLKPAYEESKINLIEIQPHGIDFLDRLDDWYGTPTT